MKVYNITLGKSEDYTFKFEAPEGYKDSATKKYPWNQENINNSSIPEHEQALAETWINDHPTQSGPCRVTKKCKFDSLNIFYSSFRSPLSVPS